MPDMETSTFIAVAPPRDLLALLTSIFTISTGLILAMGAVYAYFLQRARYLRDIEPDLRFMNEFRVREQYGDSISTWISQIDPSGDWRSCDYYEYSDY